LDELGLRDELSWGELWLSEDLDSWLLLDELESLRLSNTDDWSLLRSNSDDWGWLRSNSDDWGRLWDDTGNWSWSWCSISFLSLDVGNESILTGGVSDGSEGTIGLNKTVLSLDIVSITGLLVLLVVSGLGSIDGIGIIVFRVMVCWFTIGSCRKDQTTLVQVVTGGEEDSVSGGGQSHDEHNLHHDGECLWKL